MRRLTIISLFLIMFSGLSVQAQKHADQAISMVILELPNADTKQWDALVAKAGSEMSLTIEYTCRDSDILVVKWSHNFHEKADVQQFVSRKVRLWGDIKKVNVLYIDLKENSIGKC